VQQPPAQGPVGSVQQPPAQGPVAGVQQPPAQGPGTGVVELPSTSTDPATTGMLATLGLMAIGGGLLLVRRR
jgi:LPXTG-motif cell wall-anchored protein